VRRKICGVNIRKKAEILKAESRNRKAEGGNGSEALVTPAATKLRGFAALR
jgi:hypothetical protein